MSLTGASPLEKSRRQGRCQWPMAGRSIIRGTAMRPLSLPFACCDTTASGGHLTSEPVGALAECRAHARRIEASLTERLADKTRSNLTPTPSPAGRGAGPRRDRRDKREAEHRSPPVWRARSGAATVSYVQLPQPINYLLNFHTIGNIVGVLFL